MGVVYKAYDASLKRVVALKTLRSGALAGAEEVERFYREARATAKLNHPHIVPVYEVGRHDDHHYFCMAFVTGGSLADHLKRFHGDCRASVALVEKVARAVHYAHSKGILHRDLKPANILLDERGEPQVSDFGLAKLLDADVELTQTGHTIGTPPYMSPEQASGGAVGPHSNVWSLGVMLYELLTNRRPFLADGRGGLLQAIRLSDPPRPRSLRANLDGALDIICLKCLEKDPAWRFPTAEALADDLHRWLDGQAIVAPPSRRFARAWRRHSRLLQLLGLGLLTAMFAGVVLLLAAWRLGPSAAEGPPRSVRVEELQQQLLQGKPVTLIGETGVESGRLPAFEWVAGRDKSTADVSDSRPFGVRTNEAALLELLPAVSGQGCAFRAEVRVEAPATAGIYFGRHSFPTASGVEHCLNTLTLREGENGRNVNVESVELNSRRLRGSGQGDGHNFGLTYLSREEPPSETWRRLEVHLSAAQVQVFWEGELLVATSHRELNDGVKTLLANPRDPLNLPYDYAPSDPVGLFVMSGDAAFRRVVVEPLGDVRQPQP